MNIIFYFYEKNFKINIDGVDFKAEKVFNINNCKNINIDYILKNSFNININNNITNFFIFFYDFSKDLNFLSIILPSIKNITIKYMFSKNSKIDIKYKHKIKNYESIAIENTKHNYSNFNFKKFFRGIKIKNLVLSGFKKLNTSNIKSSNQIFLTNIDYVYGKLKLKKLSKLKIMFIENISNNFIKSLNNIKMNNLYLLNVEKINKIIFNKNIQNIVINEVNSKTINIKNIKFFYYENFYSLKKIIEKFVIENVNEVVLGTEPNEKNIIFIKNLNKLKLKFLIYNFNEIMKILENLYIIKKIYGNNTNILQIKIHLDIDMINNKNIAVLAKEIKKKINNINNLKNIDISKLDKIFTDLICNNLNLLINNLEKNLYIPDFVFKHCKNKNFINTLFI